MSSTHEPQEQWDDNLCRDGLKVEKTLGSWAIFHSSGQPLMTQCPCCNLPFKSDRAARLVADFVYPVTRNA